MKTNTILLSIFWILAFFSFYKYYRIQKKINYMKEYEAMCTDFIIKNTYQRKYYIYYYKVIKKGEEIIIEDKLILPLMKNKIKINEYYKVYVDSKNNSDYVTPVQVITYKLYLFLSLCLIIIPLFILY